MHSELSYAQGQRDAFEIALRIFYEYREGSGSHLSRLYNLSSARAEKLKMVEVDG